MKCVYYKYIFLCYYIGTDDLNDVCKAVSDCVEWNRLGLELGLKYSRLQEIEIKRLKDVPSCRIDMIAAWLRNSKKDKVMKEGVPTWKQLIQALKNIGEISLGEEIMKQRKVSNPVRSTKRKSSRRDLSTDEKRSVKKRKKEMKKRRKSSDTDSDNEERGETHRYKKRKIESGSDSSDNDDEKEEMTSKAKRKRIESSFDSHKSSNIKKRRLESSDDDERSVASKVQGKGPASGKPYKRKRVPKNKTDSESEHDDSDSEPSSKRR